MWGVLLFLSLSHPPPEFFPFSPPPRHAHHWHARHIPPAATNPRYHEPRSTQAHTHKQVGYTNHLQYSNKTKDEGENKRGETFCNEGITLRPMPRPEARKARHDESRRPHHAPQQRQPCPRLTPSTHTRHDPPPPPACVTTAHRENQTARSPKPRQDHAPRTDHQRPGDPRTLDPSIYQFIATCTIYLTKPLK